MGARTQAARRLSLTLTVAIALAIVHTGPVRAETVNNPEHPHVGPNITTWVTLGHRNGDRHPLEIHNHQHRTNHPILIGKDTHGAGPGAEPYRSAGWVWVERELIRRHDPGLPPAQPRPMPPRGNPHQDLTPEFGHGHQHRKSGTYFIKRAVADNREGGISDEEALNWETYIRFLVDNAFQGIPNFSPEPAPWPPRPDPIPHLLGRYPGWLMVGNHAGKNWPDSDDTTVPGTGAPYHSSIKWSRTKHEGLADLKIIYGETGDPNESAVTVTRRGHHPPSSVGMFVIIDNDVDWFWQVDPDPTAANKNKQDLQTVLLHEIGHVLGLDHFGVFEAGYIMAETSVQVDANGDPIIGRPTRGDPGGIQHTIDPDAIHGIRDLYAMAGAGEHARRVSRSFVPPGGAYGAPEGVPVDYVDEQAGVFIALHDTNFRPDLDSIETFTEGSDEIQIFQSTLEGSAVLHEFPGVDPGLLGTELPFLVSGEMQTIAFDRTDSSLGTFNTAIVSMELTGGFVLPTGEEMPVVIRASQTVPSTGLTWIGALENGEFRVESFFDAATEISLDEGQTFTPSATRTAFELLPERLTWNGLGDGNWNSTAQWIGENPADVPHNLAYAVIRTNTVTVDNQGTAYSLKLGEGGKVLISAEGTLTLERPLEVIEGTQVDIQGALKVSSVDVTGNLALGPAGTLDTPHITLSGGTFSVDAPVAEYSSGLFWGAVHGPDNEVGFPVQPQTSVDLQELALNHTNGFNEYTTHVFYGEFYDEDGNISFQEDIDDNVFLKIDGEVVINDSEWNTPTETGKLALEPGWHTIELRLGQVAGGAGPVTFPGFGYDADGGNNYVYPSDPGDGSLFRATLRGPIDLTSTELTVTGHAALSLNTPSTGHVGRITIEAGKSRSPTYRRIPG